MITSIRQANRRSVMLSACCIYGNSLGDHQTLDVDSSLHISACPYNSVFIGGA